MNLVFVLLLVAAAIAGAVRGDIKAVGQGALDGASQGVTLAIGLIGVMALWLGLMRIAEKAGLVEKLARAARPIFRPLFPGIPDGHPAISAMLLNIAANMMGLGNAATPFGIKAMEELEKLNPTPGTATNAQVLFLAINTASLQLVPTTVLAPITGPLGLPAEVLPMALVRPFSGSGALGLLGNIFATPGLGPDSYAGKLGSVLQGSTETTFYVLSVYCGSVGIVRYRHALAAGLLADFTGLTASVLIARMLWL